MAEPFAMPAVSTEVVSAFTALCVRKAEAAGNLLAAPRMIPAAFLSLAATATLTTPQILDRVLVRGVGHVGEFGAFCPAEEKDPRDGMAQMEVFYGAPSTPPPHPPAVPPPPPSPPPPPCVRTLTNDCGKAAPTSSTGARIINADGAVRLNDLERYTPQPDALHQHLVRLFDSANVIDGFGFCGGTWLAKRWRKWMEAGAPMA